MRCQSPGASGVSLDAGKIPAQEHNGSSLVTKTRVTPQGSISLVEIPTTWDGAGGIGGFFERLFAPRVMRGIYADELERIDACARQHCDTW